MKFLTLAALFLSCNAFAHGPTPGQEWAAVRAPDARVRTAIVGQGFSIETVRDDISYGFAPAHVLERLTRAGFEVVDHAPVSDIRAFDFPKEDAIYHNYARLNQEIDALVAAHPKVAHKFSIGKTGEGRDIVGIRLSTQAKDGLTPTALPGIVFMGGHHAREHLSVEVPLLLAKFLAESQDSQTQRLLNTRDIFIVPMMNPDGAEFDIASGSYQMWRKNRKAGTPGCEGVDINRNYGFMWGTGGSSSDPCSDVYMGPRAFSEPETLAAKAFVESHLNIKMLLTLHTFSELVLYPWGYTDDPLSNVRDLATFEKMAKTMAGWNGYVPEPTHDLYTTSGDTTDWAYGQFGIFAFTFEMSPGNDHWGGDGFYPGAAEIQHSFQANLKPAMYMIDLADNPYRAVTAPQTTMFYEEMR